VLCLVDWGNGKQCSRTDPECTNWHYGVDIKTLKSTAAGGEGGEAGKQRSSIS